MDLNTYINNKWRILVRESNAEGLTSQEIMLLDALAAADDMQDWSKSFTPRNQLLLELTSWKSITSIKRARSSLVEKGFILFRPRKRKAGVYQFTNKITGKPFKHTKVPTVDYRTEDGTNLVHLYTKPQPTKKTTVSPEKNKEKALKMRYWRAFISAVMPAINYADVSQQDYIRSMFYSYEEDFLIELIDRFNEMDWHKVRDPARYLIVSMKNDLKNQKIRKSMREKEKRGK